MAENERSVLITHRAQWRSDADPRGAHGRLRRRCHSLRRYAQIRLGLSCAIEGDYESRSGADHQHRRQWIHAPASSGAWRRSVWDNGQPGRVRGRRSMWPMSPGRSTDRLLIVRRIHLPYGERGARHIGALIALTWRSLLSFVYGLAMADTSWRAAPIHAMIGAGAGPHCRLDRRNTCVLRRQHRRNWWRPACARHRGDGLGATGQAQTC